MAIMLRKARKREQCCASGAVRISKRDDVCAREPSAAHARRRCAVRSQHRGSYAGQATVEMAVLLPVILAMVVVAFNAVSFLGTCASFDRVFPQQARVFAAAPAFNANKANIANDIQAALASYYEQECTNVQVTVSDDAFGNTTFQAAFDYEPHLFGMQFRSLLFGVSLPSLHHSSSYALNCYRPGVII